MIASPWPKTTALVELGHRCPTNRSEEHTSELQSLPTRRSSDLFSSRQLGTGRIFTRGLNDRQPMAENHRPGGTGPPVPHESPLVQAALSPPNLLNTMQLRKLQLGARHWHSACTLSGRPFSRARWRYLGNS